MESIDIRNNPPSEPQVILYDKSQPGHPNLAECGTSESILRASDQRYFAIYNDDFFTAVSTGELTKLIKQYYPGVEPRGLTVYELSKLTQTSELGLGTLERMLAQRAGA